MIDFDEFVREQQESLRRFLLSLCGGNQPLADDLAQETFIKAYLAIHTFSSKSTCKTWLFKIAFNHFIDYKRRQPPLTADIDVANVLPSDYAADGGFEHENLYRAIARLSDHERAVTLLFYMEDKSVKEIAKIMDIKEGTVKMQLSRAREHIRNFLKTRDYV